MELLSVVAMIGALAALGIPSYLTYLNKAKNTRAISEVRMLQEEITHYKEAAGKLPSSLAAIGRSDFLDPWGTPYQYLEFSNCDTSGSNNKPKCEDGKARKDRFLVPINSDYDLYSKGQDRDSNAPLTAGPSRDDIVRAADGAFIGLAVDF